MLLCLIATLQPLLMEVAKRGNGGHAPFHTSSAVFYTEAVKLVVAFGVWAAQARHLEYNGLERFRASTALAYAVPAALFAVQNNLTYFAMQLLDPQVTHSGPTLSTVAQPRSLPRPNAPGIGLAPPPSPQEPM